MKSLASNLNTLFFTLPRLTRKGYTVEIMSDSISIYSLRMSNWHQFSHNTAKNEYIFCMYWPSTTLPLCWLTILGIWCCPWLEALSLSVRFKSMKRSHFLPNISLYACKHFLSVISKLNRHIFSCFSFCNAIKFVSPSSPRLLA